MKRCVSLAVFFASLFAASALNAQDYRQYRSFVAEYECVSDGGGSRSTGTILLYDDFTCDLFENNRKTWSNVNYHIDSSTLILTATDRNGAVCEVTYAIIPDNSNGQQAYKTVWVSFFDNGQAVFSTIFNPLGNITKDGSRRINGRMIKTK